MALEINTEWNAYNKKSNYTAKTDDTLAVGPKNKRDEIKHVYKDTEKRWNKKIYAEDKLKINQDNIAIKPKSFEMYKNISQKNQVNNYNNLKNKIALIGFGYWGKIYYKYLKNNNKIIVFTRSKIKNVTNLHNCEFTNKISKILKDKDIKKVFVITPINTHFQISKKFLNANKKVLCEKPLILKQTESNLIEKKFNNQIFVSYPYTYSRILKKS